MDSMTAARVQLIDLQPFYGALLQNCLFTWNESINTAAVGVDKSGRLHLIVAPRYWESLSEEHRVGLLMHEMLHLALKHLQRGKDLDQELANIAQDIALNQYIPANLVNQNWLTPEKYGLLTGQSYEFYYLELSKRPKQETKKMSAKLADNHDGVESL